MPIKHKFCSNKFGAFYYGQGRNGYLFYWQDYVKKTVLSTRGRNTICFLAENPNTADVETTECRLPRVRFEWRANSIEQSL